MAADPAAAGNRMRTKEFLSRLDHDRVVAAIRRAEAKSSGQIRIYVQRGELADDALEHAQQKFTKLGMHKTTERNGILIFVAPRARKFAVIGDEGVHARCGNEFWDQLVEGMGVHFSAEHFTDAIVDAIDEAGSLLARYFPKTSASENELPDDVIEG